MDVIDGENAEKIENEENVDLCTNSEGSGVDLNQYMPPADENTAGNTAETAPERAPETFVVTETKYNHTDPYAVNAGYTKPESRGEDRYTGNSNYAGAAGYQGNGNYSAAGAYAGAGSHAGSASYSDAGRYNGNDGYAGYSRYNNYRSAPSGNGTAQNTVASEKKQSGARVSIPALIIICLICSILSAAACIAGYRLISKSSSKTGSDGTAAATLTNTENGGTVQSDVNNGKQQVSITVDSTVTSPATAVAAKVLPSIVGIRTEVTSTSSWYGTTVSAGEGSGVIFTDDGYIITNFHVVSDAVTTTGEPNPNASVSVYLYSDPETPIEATVIGYDQASDLAVIKIDRTGLTPIDIGDSDALSVGDTAIAIGNPGGLQFMGSVSQGIISGLNRSIQVESSYKSLKLIQTDAAINPGNSGGALTDVNGNLIGINSVKISVEGFEGMGFAIPVNDVVTICTDIIKNGNTKMAYLGIELNTDYSAEYLKRLGYPGGLLVKSVASGSPAEKAGIEEEDIIVSFNGTEVTTAEELVALKNQCSAGDKVTIRIYRLTSSRFGRWTGEYYDVEVTMG